MRILIVRTSSLGDLIHLLPAISDIKRHVPEAVIDWVVEEAFAEIPRWHSAVNDVITVAHRRWRRTWWSAKTRSERRAVTKRLQSVPYDIVLDMQALLKSIGFVRAARGVKHGLDWSSSREPLCTLFYDVRHRVTFWQPAVTRQRLLAAAALSYEIVGDPDFGLDHLATQASTAPYAVIMPSASRDDKLWPPEDWQAVFEALQTHGLALRLLAGNAAERARAQQLINALPNAVVEPKSSLTELAALMAGARIMVGLDSGLTHLSAAVGTDTIGIYKASTPVRTPLEGRGFVASLGDRDRPPSRDEVLIALRTALSSDRS
jgi:heptosyltransferase-1